MTEQAEKTPLYSWYALALLMVIYVLNFLDRTIIYILFPLIKKEMEFSDTQLALLGTTSFVIFYTILGIPFGRIADRGSRSKIIAIGVIVWSLFSGLTAFANDFWTLFACRLMVGVGEATLGPAAISLLADYFPPARRATVTSIYSMGIAIGAGMAALLGGSLSQFGWRTAFMLIGFPGIVFGMLAFVLKEPSRTIAAANDVNYSPTDWKRLLKNPIFILLCLGYSLFGLATNSISIWGAVFISRVHTIDIPTYGFWAGVMTLAAGIPATLFAGALADWFKAKGFGRMAFGTLLCLISVPLWIAVLFSGNFYVIVPAGFLLLFTGLGWVGAAAADVTEIAGVNLRGLGIAMFFFAVNVGSYLIGSNVIGILSDRFGSTAEPKMLSYALLVCPAACLLGAILLFAGNRKMKAVA
ncbi:MAG: MFS transporter [Pyrinomonadaceae bacterium]|nr:MFS transporter [Acidobacteriota bacterium]MBP7377442.1 MFS transporter [Pyrinomonadaceae bacterium]